MIIDTHTHVVSSDKVRHPLDPGARGWSTEVSNDVADLISEMDQAGVECATLVQPNGTYGLDNSYQCDSAQQYAPRTVSVGILDPAAPDAADKLSYWVNEHGMKGVRLQSDAEPDDPRCDALWQRAESLGIPISIGGGGQPEKMDRMRNVGARHPNVIFAPDHFAGWSGAADKAAMTVALEAMAELPNAFLRISSTSLGPYAALTPPEQELFRRVIEAFTPERVMWGSNFPGTRDGGYIGQVRLGQTALPWLSDEDRDWIMGGNCPQALADAASASPYVAVLGLTPCRSGLGRPPKPGARHDGGPDNLIMGHRALVWFLTASAHAATSVPNTRSCPPFGVPLSWKVTVKSWGVWFQYLTRRTGFRRYPGILAPIDSLQPVALLDSALHWDDALKDKTIKNF